ncbi:MAG TPA: Gfo/Idh/MocA family oxidoreductase [Chloroflexota bacterium]|nr:Gfo/Idh/MocA family oxidoreductase [Chloroflexota bacterium]
MALNVGIIGCGDIALKNYLPGTKNLAGTVDIVATCDTRYDRAVRAGEEFGVEECRAYGSVEEMLGDPKVEAVEVLTPWPYHFQLTLQALQAGKHVYVQKPMCQTLEEANQLIEEANRRGLVLAAAPPNMISPTMQRIRTLIQEGVLGKVALVYCHSSHGGATGPGRYTDSQWFFMKEAGAWTSLVDMGVYGLHTVTGLLGPAKRLTAFSGIAYPDRTFTDPENPEPRPVQITSHDNGIVMLDWGEGTMGTVDGSFTMIVREGPGLVIYGREGVISSAGRGGNFRLYRRNEGDRYPAGWSEVDPEGNVVATGEEAGLPQAGARGRRGGQGDRGRDVAHWAECVLQGKKPILSAEHARHVVEIMEKAVVASQTGQAQELTTTF